MTPIDSLQGHAAQARDAQPEAWAEGLSAEQRDEVRNTIEAFERSYAALLATPNQALHEFAYLTKYTLFAQAIQLRRQENALVDALDRCQALEAWVEEIGPKLHRLGLASS